MIAIIDYGMGNLGSVAKAFLAIGARVKVTQFPKDLDNADKIILPGVGAFRYCISALKKLGLVPPLIKNIEAGKPYLGLCLGMQVLFDESEEGGRVKGLGIFKGNVKRFKKRSFGRSCSSRPQDQICFANLSLKVPHMGWNQIHARHCERASPRFAGQGERSNLKKEIASSALTSSRPPRNDGECPLLKGIPDGAWMYFVHSYYVVPKDKNIIAATTDYGIDFTSMVWKDNIYATQFHPEKSQKMGMKMLEDFVKL